jgi:hypothetical protein
MNTPTISRRGTRLSHLAALVILTLVTLVLLSGGSVASGVSNVSSTHLELDLLDHQSFASPSLVYNGYFNTNNQSFPALLTGSATPRFWPRAQSVLLMAPNLPYGHDTGTVLFPAQGSSVIAIDAIAAFDGYPPPPLGGVMGDGLEAYFLLTPPHISSWATPYYATDPEGNGTLTYPEGSVMFPYSTTPYVAVQWDPAFENPHPFNLYLVRPGPGGVVNASDIQVRQIGNHPGGSGSYPALYRYLHFEITYNLGTNILSGSVSTVLGDRGGLPLDDHFLMGLSSLGFKRPVTGDPSLKSFYFGVGASGNDPTGWGLLYLDLHSSTSVTSPIVLANPIEMKPNQ